MNIFVNFSIYNALMILIGVILVCLALFKEHEPAFMLPFGFGTVLANMPYLGDLSQNSYGEFLYQAGIQTHIFPLLILLGIGTMLDFGPLIGHPKYLFYSIAGQLGIMLVFILGSLFGLDIKEAASVGLIGALDGSTAIYVSTRISPHLIILIGATVYFYKSFAPVTLKYITRVLTTPKERDIKIDHISPTITKRSLVLFPIIVTLIYGLLIPESTLLIGMLMLGNLLRVNGVTDRMCSTVQNEVVNITTLLLGLTMGLSMNLDNIARIETILVLGLGILAVILNILFGLLIGKILVLISKRKINPLLCIAGVSPFPLSGQATANGTYIEGYENISPESLLAIDAGARITVLLLGGIFITLTSGIVGLP